ncbi:hypothetical protein UFOVP245_110 [uncultured Caudovirales phage]|uniref:Uncharacterized protein n=1 Tax=uncultured Caudovirales phage TaxID=2100421 RepID=A0A6J7WT45_9CAUD|nr:hypothetical protein UFOVP245_110 [uncultured Caudovirales phage]
MVKLITTSVLSHGLPATYSGGKDAFQTRYGFGRAIDGFTYYTLDMPTVIKPSKDGGFYIGGPYNSIIKYDANCSIKWAANSAPTSMYVNGIAEDSKGNVYCVGSLNYNGLQNDMVIVKYNSVGTQVLRKDLKGAGNDNAHSIAIDSLDNYYVIGSSNTGATNVYCVVSKWSNTDVLTWQRKLTANATYGGSVWGYHTSVNKTFTGNVIISGIYNLPPAGVQSTIYRHFFAYKTGLLGTNQIYSKISDTSRPLIAAAFTDGTSNSYFCYTSNNAGTAGSTPVQSLFVQKDVVDASSDSWNHLYYSSLTNGSYDLWAYSSNCFDLSNNGTFYAVLHHKNTFANGRSLNTVLSINSTGATTTYLGTLRGTNSTNLIFTALALDSTANNLFLTGYIANSVATTPILMKIPTNGTRKGTYKVETANLGVSYGTYENELTRNVTPASGQIFPDTVYTAATLGNAAGTLTVGGDGSITSNAFTSSLVTGVASEIKFI